MKAKIGIIGSGNVGSALARGLSKAGYETRTSTEDNVREVAAGANIVLLAVPFGAVDDVVKKLGDSIIGKVVIDVTNALTAEMKFALTSATSGAEQLQQKIPTAKVVKAFNTVFAQNMESGKLNGKALTAFVASNDETARKQVLELARDIGFDAVSVGPLENSRHLESVGYLNIQLGYVLGNGTETGFIYAHK